MKPVPAALVVVALLAGGALGWSLRPSGAVVPEEATRRERAETRVKELETQVAALESAAREAATREAQRLAAPAPPPPEARPRPEPAAPVPPAEPAPAPEVRAARIVPAGYEELVAGVDWTVVGRNLHDMTPLLAQFVEEWAKTGKMPAQLVGRIQEKNGALVSAAIQAANRLKLPVTRANTAFTHPVFTANALAAMLEGAGTPLSAAQVEALGRLAEQFAAEDARRIAGYDERAWALQKSLDESLLRDRFYEAAFALLTDEQRSHLASEAVRGRVQADLFSAALVWLPRMQTMAFASPEALATAMERLVLRQFDLKDEQAGVVKDVVARWIATLPPAWLSEPADAMSLVGMVHVSRVHESARLQIRMMEDLIRSAGFDETAAAAVRGTDFVVVPVRTAPK